MADNDYGIRMTAVRQSRMGLPQLAATGVALLTFIALIGAGAVLATGAITFQRPTTTIDIATLVLMIGMMVINAVLELAGFFTWVANLVIKRTGTPMTLLIAVVVAGGL